MLLWNRDESAVVSIKSPNHVVRHYAALFFEGIGEMAGPIWQISSWQQRMIDTIRFAVLLNDWLQNLKIFDIFYDIESNRMLYF